MGHRVAPQERGTTKRLYTRCGGRTGGCTSTTRTTACASFHCNLASTWAGRRSSFRPTRPTALGQASPHVALRRLPLFIAMSRAQTLIPSIVHGSHPCQLKAPRHGVHSGSFSKCIYKVVHQTSKLNYAEDGIIPTTTVLSSTSAHGSRFHNTCICGPRIKQGVVPFT